MVCLRDELAEPSRAKNLKCAGAGRLEPAASAVGGAGSIPSSSSESGLSPFSSDWSIDGSRETLRTISSSIFSRLLMPRPSSSTRPCSMATSPMICVSDGIASAPAHTIPIPTTAGCKCGRTLVRRGPNCVGKLRDEYGARDWGMSPNMSSWHSCRIRWQMRNDWGWVCGEARSLRCACMYHSVCRPSGQVDGM